MYARVSTYDGSAEEYDAGMDVLQTSIVPQVQKTRGYKGILSLIDRSTGRSLSITLWDDEQAMIASREAANRIRSEAADTTGAMVTNVSEYEVGVIDVR